MLYLRKTVSVGMENIKFESLGEGYMAQLVKICILAFLACVLIRCSSGMSVSSDDPSLAEIEDIEKTGEFKEEDYFNDEEVLKESGVEADLEGIEGLDEGEDLEAGEAEGELLADSEVEDFEGEGFDEEDDFETDVSDASEAQASEFDESDEFATEGAVAKNEDLDEGTEEVPLAETDEDFEAEEDLFAEVDESEDLGEGDLGEGELGEGEFGEGEFGEEDLLAEVEEADKDFEGEDFEDGGLDEEEFLTEVDTKEESAQEENFNEAGEGDFLAEGEDFNFDEDLEKAEKFDEQAKADTFVEEKNLQVVDSSTPEESSLFEEEEVKDASGDEFEFFGLPIRRSCH